MIQSVPNDWIYQLTIEPTAHESLGGQLVSKWYHPAVTYLDVGFLAFRPEKKTPNKQIPIAWSYLLYNQLQSQRIYSLYRASPDFTTHMSNITALDWQEERPPGEEFAVFQNTDPQDPWQEEFRTLFTSFAIDRLSLQTSSTPVCE